MNRLYDAFRHHADAWNYLFGASGVLAAMKGFLDANTIQVWGGAIVAVGSVLWGFLRDQRKKDRIEDHAEEMRRQNAEWMAWALDYRKAQIEKTGADPFKDGIPPLVPFAEAKEADPS